MIARAFLGRWTSANLDHQVIMVRRWGSLKAVLHVHCCFGDIFNGHANTRTIFSPPRSARAQHGSFKHGSPPTFPPSRCYTTRYHSFNSSFWPLLSLHETGQRALSILLRYPSQSRRRTFKPGRARELPTVHWSLHGQPLVTAAR